MSTVHIYPPRSDAQTSSPLPQLLQTPSGLALLELQGTINLPSQTDPTDEPSSSLPDGIDVGRLDFPDYNPDAEGSAWMRRVHLYIGQHQRLTGEVKKLPKPLAVVRKRGGGESEGAVEGTEDLEIAEVVKYKILFSNRPEPVGTAITT